MEMMSLPFCAGNKYIRHVRYIKGSIYESFHFIKYVSHIACAECTLFCHLNSGHLVTERLTVAIGFVMWC